MADQGGFDQVQDNFNIPAPVEYYLFLREAEVPFSKEAMMDPEQTGKFTTTRDKAIGFGLYASDMAYCTVYEKAQNTIIYFEAAKKLADGLGLMEGFDEIAANRLEGNLESTDSLYEVSNDAYADARQYLMAEGKEDLLGLILVGSWVESVHLSLVAMGPYKADHPFLERVADQRFLLENLMDYMANLEPEKQDEEIAAKLDHVYEVFDVLYDNEGVSVTKEQFDAINARISELRTSFANLQM